MCDETHNDARHSDARHGTGLRGDNDEHRDGLCAHLPKWFVLFFSIYSLKANYFTHYKVLRDETHDDARHGTGLRGDNDEHGGGLHAQPPK